MRAALAALAFVVLITPTAASDWGDSPYGAFTAARQARQAQHDEATLIEACDRLCRSGNPACGRCADAAAGILRERRAAADAETRRRLDAAEAEIRRVDDCTNPLSLNRLNCQPRLSPK